MMRAFTDACYAAGRCDGDRYEYDTFRATLQVLDKIRHATTVSAGVSG